MRSNDKNSRLTRRRLGKDGRLAIPIAMRGKLHLGAGDELTIRYLNGGILLTRRHPIDVAFLTGLETTLSEWESEEDDEAYCEL